MLVSWFRSFLFLVLNSSTSLLLPFGTLEEPELTIFIPLRLSRTPSPSSETKPNPVQLSHLLPNSTCHPAPTATLPLLPPTDVPDPDPALAHAPTPHPKTNVPLNAAESSRTTTRKKTRTLASLLPRTELEEADLRRALGLVMMRRRTSIWTSSLQLLRRRLRWRRA